MLLFDHIPWYSIFMWVIVVFVLILVNEMARRSTWTTLFLFLVIPILLAILIWPKTAGKGSNIGTWFNYIKVCSSLVGCLVFLAIRFIKGLSKNKYMLILPAIILMLNILFAIIRDFQVYHLHGVVNGVMMVGGPWNIMNGIAGILNILTISGWMGIIISKNKYRDMVWPDQLWFWIIAYNLWNFAYVYNCVSDHSYYAGAALLMSSVIPAFLIKNGAWLQHRAQTLAIWMLFIMSNPAFVEDSKFAVQSSHNKGALWLVSFISLTINIIVFTFHMYTILKNKRNLLKEEVYIELSAYKNIVESNRDSDKLR
ncbi:DUF5692 family protein [Neobacillus sp. DY30]|uniref:DUF5692 family protein n=1 Tax=Neobacillus sp. DY30 TaxID=3047871 RepID=UPI0024C08668|nr:DUF5692 family protein [Neobacillus sp. DY30]WHX98059.1 DUF5692 family protein [Neobacillus sp. DY30]